MKNRLVLAVLILLTAAVRASGQSYVTVTATVTDPNSTVYALGTYSVTLSNTTGQQPQFGGSATFQQVYSGLALSSTGTFSIVLPSTAVMTPGGLQWTFRICANPAQVAGVFPPVALPCFSYTSTGTLISGTSVDLSSQIKAVAATIPLAAGGGVSSNSPLPLATSGPGPVFNVANYTGAFHDTRSNSTCDTSINGTQVTCSVVAGVNPFCDAGATPCQTGQVSVVGMRINCADGLNGNQYPNGTTISSVVSSTVAQLSQTRLAANTGQKCTYGHPDDVALVAAFSAALAQSQSVAGQARGNAGKPTAAPTLYLPAGGWMVCTPSSGLPMFAFNTSRKGFTIQGDGYDVTFLYNCDNTSTSTGSGYWIANNNMTTLLVKSLTIDGGFLPVNMGGFNDAVYTAAETEFYDFHMQAVRANGGLQAQGGIFANHFILDTSDGTILQCSGCNGEFRNWGVSNAPAGANNLTVQNVIGLNFGQGVKFFGGIVDEGGSSCVTKIINSQDVWFIGTAGFGTGGQCAISVDGQSFVHLIDDIWGVFGNDGNAGGISIAAGGIVQASDTRFVSSGTRAPVANLGTFNNNGGNSSESMFQIVSGTSTGTTVVLTLTPNSANVNTNCSTGDAWQVEGAGIVGYNGSGLSGATTGLTGVTATTATFTSIGSNMGALGAGGTFFCRNAQNNTGNPPRQLLAPSQFNCNVPVLTATTTTGTTNCFFTPDRDIYLDRFSAGMGTAPVTCSPNAILQVSNGTNTQNLTISAAQNDSGAIATPVLLKRNTLIGVIVQTAAAGCGTSPANAAVNLFWHAGFDN